MSLWNSEVKSQLESSTNFSKLEKDLDSIGLLSTIKKLVHKGGINDLNVRHNNAMPYIKLMNLYQDKFQGKFRDKYMAMREVCNKLRLKFGKCTEDAKAVLMVNVISKPTSAQLMNAVDNIEEEHHAIIFQYKADKS